jgi:hypothetical protein
MSIDKFRIGWADFGKQRSALPDLAVEDPPQSQRLINTLLDRNLHGAEWITTFTPIEAVIRKAWDDMERNVPHRHNQHVSTILWALVQTWKYDSVTVTEGNCLRR